jgi:hypothetical protein
VIAIPFDADAVTKRARKAAPAHELLFSQQDVVSLGVVQANLEGVPRDNANAILGSLADFTRSLSQPFPKNLSRLDAAAAGLNSRAKVTYADVQVGDVPVCVASLDSILEWCLQLEIAMGGGALDTRPRPVVAGENAVFPPTFHQTVGWRFVHSCYGAAFAAGATVVGVGLYRDEMISLGRGTTVVRCAILASDFSFTYVWPLVTAYDTNIVDDDEFLRVCFLPFLSRLSAGIQLDLPGVGQLTVVGCLCFYVGDMKDRWAFLHLVNMFAPTSCITNKKHQTFPQVGAVTHFRNLEATCDLYVKADRFLCANARVKTKAKKALRWAGVDADFVAQNVGGERLASVFVFSQQPHLQVFRSMGVLRAGPDWLHSSGVGLKRTWMRSLGLVVFNYSYEFSLRIDNVKARAVRYAVRAFTELNDCVRDVQRFPTLRRVRRPFFVYYNSKKTKKTAVKTTYGSGKLFEDIYLQLPEVLFMLTPAFIDDDLIAWCRRFALLMRSHVDWELALEKSSQDVHATVDKLTEQYVKLLHTAAELFDDRVSRTAHSSGAAVDDDDDAPDLAGKKKAKKAAREPAAAGSGARRKRREHDEAESDSDESDSDEPYDSSESEDDDEGSGEDEDEDDEPEAEPEDVTALSFGERKVLLPKAIDVLSIAPLTSLLLPFRLFKNLGALMERGHQYVKAAARQSHRHDHSWTATVFRRETRRMDLELKRAGGDDGDVRARAPGRRDDDVVCLAKGLSIVAALPVVVRDSILTGHDAAAVAAFRAPGAGFVSYRGVHVDCHRLYAADMPNARRRALPPFLQIAWVAGGVTVRVYGFLTGVFGIIDAVESELGRPGRKVASGVTRDNAREPQLLVLQLARYGKSASPCPCCKWPYFTPFTQRGTESHAVVLRSEMLVELMHVNLNMQCPVPPSERAPHLLHKNPRVRTISAPFLGL